MDYQPPADQATTPDLSIAPPGEPVDPGVPGAPDAPGYPDAPGSPDAPSTVPTEPPPIAPDEPDDGASARTGTWHLGGTDVL
jgi:hypothetical protein